MRQLRQRGTISKFGQALCTVITVNVLTRCLERFRLSICLSLLLVVSPHQLWLNPLWMVLLSKRGTPVIDITGPMKTLAGPLMRASNPIFVDKSDPKSRAKAAAQINKQAHSPKTHPQIIIAPEGAITNGKGLLKFKVILFFLFFTLHMFLERALY